MGRVEHKNSKFNPIAFYVSTGLPLQHPSGSPLPAASASHGAAFCFDLYTMSKIDPWAASTVTEAACGSVYQA